MQTFLDATPLAKEKIDRRLITIRQAKPTNLQTAPADPKGGPSRDFFGEGIVGGPMQMIAGQTKKAAEVALRILDGEKPGDIKPSFVELAAPMFDWRQMQRWGISESDLHGSL